LFGVFYLIGESDYFRQNRLFANPFLIAGVLGTIVIFLVWSYEGLWSELHETSFRSGGVSRSIFFYISLFAMLVQVYLFIRWRKQLGPEYNPMGISVFVLAICVLAFPGVPFMGLIIVNAWVLIIAMFYIRKGAQKNHLGILNLGLLIIAALALLRFFDESIPFVWRGLFFVATGVGFIVANYLLLKKRKSLT
jgi:asparagine N-glycosylation enzyme membrane subunit Stt3